MGTDEDNADDSSAGRGDDDPSEASTDDSPFDDAEETDGGADAEEPSLRQPGVGPADGTSNTPDTPVRADVLDRKLDRARTPETVQRSVLADLRAAFDSGTATVPELDRPTESFLETSFFDFEPFEGRRELTGYWVQKPFAYVSVLVNPTNKRRTYHVLEPTLDEFERYLRQDLATKVRQQLRHRTVSADDSEREFERELAHQLARHGKAVDDGTLYKLLYYFRRDFLGYGLIDPLMRDGNIEDVSCDGHDLPTYVYHHEYENLRTNVVFSEDRLDSFVDRLANKAGTHVSVASPLRDATLPDGSRLQLTRGGDVGVRGSNFTIRKFAEVPLTPVDLIRSNTYSAAAMAFVWLAVEHQKSFVFAGPTAAGKTTAMNAVSLFIPPDSKVVSIEDTRELALPHDNWIAGQTRESATVEEGQQVTMYDLLQAALHQRPEYLIIGEIRMQPSVVRTFFQAIGTGHAGFTTFHANSAENVLRRFEQDPLSIPKQMLEELDLVGIHRMLRLEHRRLRRLHHLTEMGAGGRDVPAQLRTLFEWDASTDTIELAVPEYAASDIVSEIVDIHGWSDEQLLRDVQQRAEILWYMVGEGVTDFEDVAAVIQTAYRDREFLLDAIRSESFDPADLRERVDTESLSPTDVLEPPSSGGRDE
jgi:flagellar protein FlaI